MQALVQMIFLAMPIILITRVASRIDSAYFSVFDYSLRCVSSMTRHSSLAYPSKSYRFPSRMCATSIASSLPTNSAWEEITNHKTSKTVKLFKSVHRANKSKRSELGLTVAEGVRLVSDILSNEQSRHLVRRIVVSESLLHHGEDHDRESNADQYHEKLRHWLRILDEESRQRNAQSTAGNTYGPNAVASCSINVGSDEVVAACSGTVSSQGIAALVEIPPPYDPNLVSSAAGDVSIVSQSVFPPFYLILDGLSDPGNVGSLLRSCAASYVSAMILLPGSCDVWNPKAVRASMGASFRVPILEISKSDSQDPFEQLLDYLERCSVDSHRVYAATMDVSGDNASLAHYDVDFTREGGGAAVILGTEGEGLRSDVRCAIKLGKISTVHVPMASGMESLNASVCGSVIMFERNRQLLSTHKDNRSVIDD